MTKNNTNCPACHGCGWLKAFNTDTQKHEIQRCDVCEKFQRDEDIQEHPRRATDTSEEGDLTIPSSVKRFMTNNEKKQLGAVLLGSALIFTAGWLLVKRVQHVERVRQEEQQAIEAQQLAEEQNDPWVVEARAMLEGGAVERAQDTPEDLKQRIITEQRQYQEMLGADIAQTMFDPSQSAETLLRQIQNNHSLQRAYGLNPWDSAFMRAFRSKHQEMLDAYDRQPTIILIR